MCTRIARPFSRITLPTKTLKRDIEKTENKLQTDAFRTYTGNTTHILALPCGGWSVVAFETICHCVKGSRSKVKNIIATSPTIDFYEAKNHSVEQTKQW